MSVVPLSFLIALFVISTVLQNKTEQTARWSQRSQNALNQSARIEKTLTDANRSVADSTKRVRGATLTDFKAAVRDLPAQERELQRLVRDEPGQPARAARYIAVSNDVMRILSEYLADSEAGHKAQAQALIASPRTRKLSTDYSAAKNGFDQAERVITIGRFNALHDDFESLGRVLLAGSIAGILLTLGVTALFGLRIARRLRRLAANARRLESGEPTEVIEGRDEIADLDRVYHEMSRRIHETLRQKDDALAAYDQAHNVASTLQRALLPQELPKVSGVLFDGVYEPGKTEAQVGGDWYDALRLSDGRVLISIGDVAGSGLQAAVIMAAMREVIRGVAQVYADPAAMIDAADRTLKSEHPDRLVTAFVAVFDPVARTLAYLSAGHPAPLLRRPDGRVVDLPSRGLPLGLRARDDVDARTAKIPDGAMLVFYTDGLTESTRDVIAGERRVRQVLADPAIVTRSDVAQALYDGVLADGTHDDVAILVMRLGAPSGAADRDDFRRWTFDTDDVATAQRSRAVFASVLGDGGMFDEDVFTSELIFGELLSNTVRYAPGPVEVVLEWNGTSAAILHFLDRGPGFVLMPWLPSDLLSERGRGLFLVWSLSEDFNVTKRTDGGAHARVVLSPRRKRGGEGASAGRPAEVPAAAPE